MGRWYYNKKDEADDYHKITTSWLYKYGYLAKGTYSNHGGITWTWGLSENKSSVSYNTCTIHEDEKFPSIRFMYTQTDRHTEVKTDFDYLVRLEPTPCNYGGVRWWFICPLVSNGVACNRRVGALYLGGKYFGCRHCYNLSYESRNKNRRYRMQPLFDYLWGVKSLEDIEATIKRQYYAGRPTRKMRKLLKIQNRLIMSLPIVSELSRK